MTENTLESPCLAPKEWNIYQRINWVRSQIGYVQKTKTVSGQGYKAVTHDEVTGMVRAHLIKAGVNTVQTLMESTFEDTGQKTKSGTPIYLYTGDYLVSFVNSDDPEDLLILSIEAQALDFGDKAPGKAMSYAKKYAYLKTFDIETGEDEESRIEAKLKAPELITAEQEEIIAARIKEHDIEDGFYKWMNTTLKCSTLKEIQANAFDLVQKRIDSAIRSQEKAG